MAEQMLEKAMDEVYDILLYNPSFVDNSTKKRLLDKMMTFYIDIEDYSKCQHIKELLEMLERPNENSNKKTRPSV